ncbi:putative transporter small subunit [Oceanimonas sp. NS1]|nr:putative transporter small subunit [Oceanimonas sp. NS1]
MVFATGFLREYTVLLSSWWPTASAPWCVLVSLLDNQKFDFELIKSAWATTTTVSRPPARRRLNPPALPRSLDMSELTLGAYILIWPALTLWVLIMICRGVWKDIVAARKENRELV